MADKIIRDPDLVRDPNCLDEPTPPSSEMIEVHLGKTEEADISIKNHTPDGNVSSRGCGYARIDTNQPSIQSYLAQEINRRDLIPRSKAANEVEIDREMLISFLNKNFPGYNLCGKKDMPMSIYSLNPLKLKPAPSEGKKG